jgi:hypothetical protein
MAESDTRPGSIHVRLADARPGPGRAGSGPGLATGGWAQVWLKGRTSGLVPL